MNKNILKYFGLAALLALGVQTAEAADVAKVGGKEYETLAAAVAAANDGDTVTIISSDLVSINGVSINKNVTIEGAGADKTVLDMGTGSMGGVSSKTVTYRNLTLRYNNTGTMPYTQGVNHAMQAYDHVTIAGSIAVMDDTLFDTCTFTGALDDGTAVPEYLVWIYAHKATFTNCIFEKAGSKGSIKLYAEAGNMCATEVSGTTFKEIGSKGSAIYTSNSNNSSSTTKVVYEVVTDDASITVPEGKVIVKASGNGLSVVNPVKDANGKYIGGQFITASTDQATIESIIGNVCAEGYAPKKNDDGTWTVDSASAYDPTKWSGATYEAFATEPKTVEAANKFIADLPAVVKDYIAVDAANKTVALSSADAFAFITYLPKYLAALCVLDCNENGYGDPRLSAYWVGADPKPSWTVNVTTDIDLQNQAWKPATSGYSYLVDFQNHTICNLKATGLTTNGGLFGDLYYAQNVTIDGAEVATTADNAGVLAGTLNGFAKNVSVKNATLSGGKYTGAIGGYVYGDIEGCKVVGTESAPVVITSATKEVGAVAGLFTASLIKECEVAFVSVTGQEEVGGIAGRVLDGDVKEHAIVDCSVANATLKATKNGDAAVDSDVVGGSEANYVGLISGRDYSNTLVIMSDNKQLYPAPVANVVEVISADGTTTKGYPTLAEAFAATPWVDKPVNGCTVRLLADIDLAGVAWTPVSFCGTFDGNNKTISNLKVQDTTGKAGFFGTFRGTARDVTFEAADVTGSNYAAVFAAEVSNSGAASDSYLEMLIENVTVKNSVVKGVQKCGGVIGRFPESDGSIEIRGCFVDTLSILGKDPEGVWQAGGLVGYLQTMIAANAYIHDNTVKNITIADANVEYFKTSGFAHDFFSNAFIGDVINYKKLNEGGSKDGTVILEKNTVAGTNGGYQIGPNSNTYIGDYRMQDEVGGSVEKVCKIEVDGVDITIPASPEVVPERPTEEKVEKATKVVNESGEVVEPTEQQEVAAKTEVDKVAQSFDNPEIAKVETHVAEAAMTVTGEGEEQKVVVKSAIVEELQKAAPGDTAVQITPESDVKSYVKVALNEAKVAVKEEGAALKSVTFDVTPMAETTVTVDQEKTVVVAQIPNSEIAKPITFRLPLTDAFTVSAIVTHEGDPDRLCMVQGAAGARYVEVTASHFSLFTATPSEIVETTTESKTVLGIKRVDYTVTQSTDDLAAAVPWLQAADADMPVSQLITTGLTDGDQIQVYDLKQKTYYSWHYNGTAWTADTLSTGVKVPSADEYFLKRGRAFWYKPVGGKGASGTYTQVGLYSEATITSKVDSASVASASFANPVHFLMASPKYEDFNLKEKLTADAGCRPYDVVVIVATGARYRFNGTVWGQDIDKEVSKFGVTVTQKVFEATEGAISVPAGTAFWYLSAGGAPEFEW